MSDASLARKYDRMWVKSGPKPSAGNTRRGLTLNRMRLDWRAAVQSTATWKPVPGYGWAYEVSDMGQVRSIDRITPYGRRVRGKVLAFVDTASGHLKVGLSEDGRQRGRYVHTLVLEAFVGPRPEGMEARHLNGVPTDNRLENLRWGSRSENQRDSVIHGTHPQASKTHCPQGHAYVEANLVGWFAVRGERKCRSCKNARNVARRRGGAFSQEVADAYYARYVGNSGVA